MKKVIIIVMALMPIVAMAQTVRKNAINLNMGGAVGNIGLSYERLVASGKNVQLYVQGGFKKHNWSESHDYFVTDDIMPLFVLNNILSQNHEADYSEFIPKTGTLTDEFINHKVKTVTLGSNVVLAKYLEFGLTYRMDAWNRDITKLYFGEPDKKETVSVTKHYLIPSMAIRYQTKNGVLLKLGIAKGVESNKISKNLIPNFSFGYSF